MGLINPDLSGIVDGSVGDAADWTTPMNTIINTINGGLDTSNLSLGGTDLGKIASGTAWTDWGSTASGFTGTPTVVSRYMQLGKTVFIYITIQGTSNSTSFGFTLPTNAKTTGGFQTGSYVDNGSFASGGVSFSFTAGSPTVLCYTSPAGGVWTNSGGKQLFASFFYEAA